MTTRRGFLTGLMGTGAALACPAQPATDSAWFLDTTAALQPFKPGVWGETLWAASAPPGVGAALRPGMVLLKSTPGVVPDDWGAI